jgi:hypothetical protein
LAIVDQVASAWGVRQDKDGGKTAWCTLELPAQHAATIAGGRTLPPASTAPPPEPSAPTGGTVALLWR